MRETKTRTPGLWSWGSEIDTHARLIESAPQLLASLRQVTQCLEDTTDDIHAMRMDDRFRNFDMMGEVIANARSLIAKIEGGK